MTTTPHQPRLVFCAMPRTTSRHRKSAYPYAPEFLAHFDGLLIRAAQHTLTIPHHPGGYVLDTRHASHARAEVLLRRYKAHLHFVLAIGRFPHRVYRLAPLLTDLPVHDVRPTPAYPVTSPGRPRSYVLTGPTPSLTVHDHHLAGWYLPSDHVLDPAYIASTWLPALRATRTLPVILELPQMDPDASLRALRMVRDGEPCRGDVLPGADTRVDVNAAPRLRLVAPLRGPACT